MKQENALCTVRIATKIPHEWLILRPSHGDMNGTFHDTTFYCKFCLEETTAKEFNEK